MAADGNTSPTTLDPPVAEDGLPSAGPAAAAEQDAVRHIGDYLSEFVEYARHFTDAQFDLLRLRLRGIVLRAIGGLLGGIVLLAAAVAGLVYLVRGLADGLAVAFNSVWLGNLLAGALVLAVIGTGLMLMVRRMQSQSRRQRVDKYEQRKARQRARFGRDVQGSAEQLL